MREQIMEAVCNKLKSITSLASVQRWRQQGNDLAQVPCAVVSVGEETKEYFASGIVSDTLQVFIDLWIIHTDVSFATDTVLNALLGELEKSFAQDITLGGIAVSAKITRIVPFETMEGQPYAGLVIVLEIEYRTQKNLSDKE